MLFVSIGRGNFGQPITRDGMLKHYQEHYRDDYFPMLFKNPSVPSEDKEAIKKLRSYITLVFKILYKK